MLSFRLSDLVTAYRTGQYCSKDKATLHILILGEFGIRTWDPNSERKSRESRMLDTSLFCSPPHTGLLRFVKGLKRLFKDTYVWECGHEGGMWTYVLYFEVTNMFLQKNSNIYLFLYILIKIFIRYILIIVFSPPQLPPNPPHLPTHPTPCLFFLILLRKQINKQTK